MSETISTSGYRQPSADTTFEPHYTIGDLSRQWRIGRETVRLLVKDEPGVVKIRMGRRNPAEHRLPNTSEGWMDLHFLSRNLKEMEHYASESSTDLSVPRCDSRNVDQAICSMFEAATQIFRHALDQADPKRQLIAKQIHAILRGLRQALACSGSLPGFSAKPGFARTDRT